MALWLHTADPGVSDMLTHWVRQPRLDGWYPDGALCSLCGVHCDPPEWQVVGGIDIYMGCAPKLHCHGKASDYEKNSVIVGRCLFVSKEHNC